MLQTVLVSNGVVFEKTVTAVERQKLQHGDLQLITLLITIIPLQQYKK